MSQSEKKYLAYALIKFFNEEEHYNNFIKGVSLFRPPHYYRTCEDIGRGDRNESCIRYEEFSGILTSASGQNIELISAVVHKANEPNDSWLQSWSIIALDNNFEKSMERMLNEFGLYFALLPVQKIEEYKTLIRESSGLEVSSGTVTYSNDSTAGSLTTKDTKYSYQKEYRFFTGQCSKFEQDSKFLNLKGIDKLLYDAKSIKISSNDEPIDYYFSFGHDVIFTQSRK